MLQLLQPLWLFALTGISIPVIIHLWNLKPGRILKVGSISLVTESSKEYKKSLTLSDILLLILRCLLIAALAIALAKPVWRSSINSSKQKGWLLLNKENIGETYSHFKPFIDSLLKTGMGFHYFNEGFPKEDFEKVSKSGNDTTTSKLLSYWGLVSTLDETAPHSVPVYLFTDNYLKHFSGTRPTVSPNLKWFVYTPADTAILQSLQDNKSIRITIFIGKNTEDARYLKAAIDAIKEFSQKSIQLSVTSNAATIQPNQDWLFWLSDEALTNEETAKNIFTYEKGKPKNTASWIRTAGSMSFSPVEVYKTITPGNALNDSSVMIWQDGYGYPVLAREKRKNNFYYHFYNRFDPAWNELVWSSNFPALIYSLLEKNETIVDAPDKRIIDRNQLLPNFATENDVVKPAAYFKTIDLTGICWLLVFLLFFIERLISFQYYKLKAND